MHRGTPFKGFESYLHELIIEHLLCIDMIKENNPNFNRTSMIQNFIVSIQKTSFPLAPNFILSPWSVPTMYLLLRTLYTNFDLQNNDPWRTITFFKNILHTSACNCSKASLPRHL